MSVKARPPKRKQSDTRSVHAAAVRCAVQILFVGARSYTVETLREKLRDLLVEEANPELRAVAALTSLELVTALLGANETLGRVGLQLRITNGSVSLWAGPVQSKKLSDYCAAVTGASGLPDLTQTMLEVLGCVAMKQPLSQGEIDRYFDTEKRSQIERLKLLGLVEPVASAGGRILFATTEVFRQRFGSPANLQLDNDAKSGE